jgi:ferritin
MPVYSNIPHLKKQDYDLSAFLAIHNTDLIHQIKITKVDYFDTNGKLIKNFISSDQQIQPLATKIFPISKEDQSGAGANFLVEWIADQPVNEPLIESVMKDLSGNKGISFLSQGRIIREIK